MTQPSLTIKQTWQLQLLKRKLQCAEGHHPWCWVASDGSHQAITIFQITLWAQMIVCISPTSILSLFWPISLLGRWDCDTWTAPYGQSIWLPAKTNSEGKEGSLCSWDPPPSACLLWDWGIILHPSWGGPSSHRWHRPWHRWSPPFCLQDWGG